MNKFLFLGLLFFNLLYSQRPVDFSSQIKPLFQSYGCTQCHGGSGALFLSPFADIFTTGFHAPDVVPGDTNCILIQKLKGIALFGERMPLGDSVTQNDLQLFIRWIKEGAHAVPTEVRLNTSSIFSYHLMQNFPNPFNPSTSIAFSLARPEMVSLKVYDILGKEVSVLIEQYMVQGNHSISFVGTTLPSGWYFYTLTAGKYSETKKMILVR